MFMKISATLSLVSLASAQVEASLGLSSNQSWRALNNDDYLSTYSRWYYEWGNDCATL